MINTSQWCPNRQQQIHNEVCKSDVLNKKCNRKHCPRYPNSLLRDGDNPGGDTGVSEVERLPEPESGGQRIRDKKQPGISASHKISRK